MPLLLLVKVDGWDLVGGKCWNWVGADDCWDWLAGGLGTSVGEGEVCWHFFWAMVEDGSWTWAEVSFEGRLWVGAGVESCWWFEVVLAGLVSVGEWLRVWVEGRRRSGAMKAGLALDGSRRFGAVVTGLALE